MSHSSTLDRYKALARSKQEPTKFSPAWLQDCQIERYLAKKGTAATPIICFEMFQSIIKMKEIGNIIHAVGINGQSQTLLILRKP
jgi:hypothetical protein